MGRVGITGDVAAEPENDGLDGLAEAVPAILPPDVPADMLGALLGAWLGGRVDGALPHSLSEIVGEEAEDPVLLADFFAEGRAADGAGGGDW